MKTFKLIGMALVAIMLSFSFSSCEKDSDDTNRNVDYTDDIVNTWIADDGDSFEVLVFSADGTLFSDGLEDGKYWQGIKGTWTLEGNHLVLIFEDNDNFDGTIELIAGETMAMTDSATGARIVYHAADTSHLSRFVGTWTSIHPGYADSLIISPDGSIISTGYEGDFYWEEVKGKIYVANDVFSMTFADGDDTAGYYEIVAGETMILTDAADGKRYVYKYCEQDLSEEVLGMWVCNDYVQPDKTDDIVICTFNEDGTVITTGLVPGGDGFVLNDKAEYKQVGNLHIQKVFYKELNKFFYYPALLTYSPDGTAFGDIMTIKSFIPKNENEFIESTISYLRVKQTLELPGQKYGYIKTFVTNASGLDKDFNVDGITFNFSKMDGVMMDKMLKTLLFNVEFPDAKTMKYSYSYNGETTSATAPIEVDGNKMTVKMDKTRGHFRDMDLYVFQDKDNTQMHIYMSKYAFINYFGNIAVSLMAEKGEIDPTDQAAVDAVFAELTEIIKTINISFVMSKSK